MCMRVSLEMDKCFSWKVEKKAAGKGVLKMYIFTRLKFANRETRYLLDNLLISLAMVFRMSSRENMLFRYGFGSDGAKSGTLIQLLQIN